MEPSAGIRKPGSAGLPVGSSRITIVDDDGEQVPSGTIGEVVIGGDCVSQGYFGDPAATPPPSARSAGPRATSAISTPTATSTSSTARRT